MKNNDNKKTIKVCHGRNCGVVGKFILERLESDIARNPTKKVNTEECLCRGLCSEGPIVSEENNGKEIIHKRMDPIKASKIL